MTSDNNNFLKKTTKTATTANTRKYLFGKLHVNSTQTKDVINADVSIRNGTLITLCNAMEWKLCYNNVLNCKLC